MADFLITGKKGNGKSIYAVGVIRDALVAGKRVATNLDVYLEKFGNPHSRKTITRLPDCVDVSDLEAIGIGNETPDEELNGVIILDEVSKIFNSRTWGDKARQPLLDWLVHSRKKGWDVYMIAQGPEQIDKQLRTSLLEYWVTVRRTDKWPIPFITPIAKTLLGVELRLPKMHIGTTRHGFDQHALKVDRKYYKGAPLYPCYDTRQIFLDRDHPQAVGLHTVLSPWYTTGRYLPPKRTFREWLLYQWNKPATIDLPRPPAKPKHPLVALLGKLPPDQAAKHHRRLDSLGAFDFAPC